jgi:hypothetical protein
MFFTSGLFWLFEGLCLSIALIGLRLWTQERQIPMPWWKWILVLLWILFLGFTTAFIGTSLGEREPIAALRGGFLFGILTMVTGVCLWFFLGFNKKKVYE